MRLPRFTGYTRVKFKNCRMIVMNFSQPVGTPSGGIIHTPLDGSQLHVDLEDCALMGYKVFGPARATSATRRRDRAAYVQFQQSVPEGFERLGSGRRSSSRPSLRRSGRRADLRWSRRTACSQTYARPRQSSGRTALFFWNASGRRRAVSRRSLPDAQGRQERPAVGAFCGRLQPGIGHRAWRRGSRVRVPSRPRRLVERRDALHIIGSQGLATERRHPARERALVQQLRVRSRPRLCHGLRDRRSAVCAVQREVRALG